MELHILGPVELQNGEHHHRLGPPRWSGVLSYLALNVGKTVTTDVLMERLGTERSTVHSYIHGLRAALRRVTNEVRIDRRDHGYALQADPELIDYHHFRRLRQQASARADEGRPDEAVTLLREAERLWTGRTLGNSRGEWAEQTRRHLDGERLSAIVQRIRLERRLGRTGEHVNELTLLVADNPRHEELVELLMRALHGCGQTTRALDEYQEIRRLLIDAEGREPGPAMRSLQQQILHGEPDGPDEHPARPAPPPPNNLNRLLPDFVGRQAEIEELAAAFADAVPGTPGIITIHGMPGVGKSTLANHLAHRLMTSYPDGQLHVDLGAYGARGPLDPSTALVGLLGKIGMSEDQIPANLDGRADLWRTHLSGRRMLLLLDDASGHEQIRHLLPGSSASLVIITSRHRLTGLDGARSLSLPPLSDEDGSSLVRAIVAAGQLDDEESLRRVLRLCAGLPLAIRVAAAGLQARANRTIRDLAIQLDHTADLLGEFQDDDDNRSIRISFELSYQSMPAPWQRAFRLLSQHPAGEFTGHAAAAILDEPPEKAVPLVDHLIDRQLLQEHGRGRYRFHGLLLTYAKERAEAEENTQSRTACRDRLGEYFLATAERADVLLRPCHHHERIGLRPVVEFPPALTDADAARQHMELEISGIIAYARHEYVRLPELAHAVAFYLDMTTRWNEAIDVHWRAIKGWQAGGDQIGEAAAMVDLAFADLRCGRFQEGEALARDALAMYRAVDHSRGEADALDRLGLARRHLGKFSEATEHFHAAAAIRQALGDEKGTADALAHSALALSDQSRFDNAILMLERAFTTYRRIGDVRGQVETLNNLGEVQLQLGRAEDALRNYTWSRKLTGGTESPLDRATHLGNIGACRLALGDTTNALACLREALDLYHEIGDRSGIAETLAGIGAAYQALDRTDEALVHFQNAIRISREIAEPAITCRSLRHVGAIQTQLGKYRLAASQLKESLNTARRIGDPRETGLTLAELAECLLQTGQTADARSRLAEAVEVLRPLNIGAIARIEDRLRDL